MCTCPSATYTRAYVRTYHARHQYVEMHGVAFAESVLRENETEKKKKDATDVRACMYKGALYTRTRVHALVRECVEKGSKKSRSEPRPRDRD